MALLGKKQESAVVGNMEDLRAQIEAKKNEIEAKEKDLQAQLEKEREALGEREAALKEAQWQEKIEAAEKEIGQLCRQKRRKEKDINQALNKLFQETSKGVEKINTMFGELEESKKEISIGEDSLIRKGGEDGLLAKDALEFKKAEIDREIRVPQQAEGALSLIKEVNRTKGLKGELSDMLVGRKADTLPSYARNIYSELMENRSRVIKQKEDALVKLAGIPEPRIIKAREELQRCLDELEDDNLIVVEKDGVEFTIRAKEEEVALGTSVAFQK